MEIGYVNIFVIDLERAVTFYQQTLGLSLNVMEANFGYASFNAGPVTLGLAVPPEDQQSLIGGHTGIGLTVADLDQQYKTLSGKGVSFSMPPTKQPWGGFMAIMEDPDGNSFYLDQVNVVYD